MEPRRSCGRSGTGPAPTTAAAAVAAATATTPAGTARAALAPASGRPPGGPPGGEGTAHAAPAATLATATVATTTAATTTVAAPAAPVAHTVPATAPVAPPVRIMAPSTATATRRSHRSRVLIEWTAVLGGALLVALIVKVFLFQAFVIPSESMVPTLEVGDRVLVNKLSYHLHDIHRGDVVVFERPPAAATPGDDSDLIKRVIGLPGDTVEGSGGVVFVNRQPLDERYLPAGRGHAGLRRGRGGRPRGVRAWATTARTPVTAASSARCRPTTSSAGPSPRVWPLGALSFLS